VKILIVTRYNPTKYTVTFTHRFSLTGFHSPITEIRFKKKCVLKITTNNNYNNFKEHIILHHQFPQSVRDNFITELYLFCILFFP
jgi:hypothetical protein